jgi:soluble lytic murein transglycosylase
MELARAAVRKKEYGKSIRYIKGLVPGYLWMPFDSAPEEFWRLAYPLHYKDQLLRYARSRDLDLFFLAALIRQESEFDPRAVSRAKAIGLTQVLPSTGRELSRKLGYQRFSPAMLYRPEVNLNLGTYYLRQLVDTLEGHVEAALASYNAGLSRARLWLSWAQYREPAEYIETIPITETRNYVAIVLRNAEIYRRLYAGEAAGSLVAALTPEQFQATDGILQPPH